MIKSIRIRNFQCHKFLEVKFDPGVTTIVGPTDSGKSAVIRALKWLVFNRPSGQAFLRHGDDKLQVSVSVDDSVIHRRKGDRNEYRLNARHFKAIGVGVPEDIERLLNLTTDNFQDQHDAPFWLSLTPGQVSKEVNRIVDLGVIDRSLKKVGSRLRRAKSRLQVAQERLDEAIEDRSQLRWVKRASRELDEVESVYAKMEQCVEERLALTFLAEGISELRGSLERASDRRSDVQTMISCGDQIMDLRDRQRQLTEMGVGVSTLEKQLRRLEDERKQVRHKLSQVKECPLCRNPM